MSKVISMNEFNSSKQEATNLTDEEKEDASLEQSMNEARDLLEMVVEASNYDLSTLYFLWCDIGTTLSDVGGWSPEELAKDVLDTVGVVQGESNGPTK